MCVLIHNKPNSRKLTRDEFNASWFRNPHGFGVMYSKDNKVVVKKSMNIDESFRLYEESYADAKWASVVTHFRFKTHGEITIANVHPFPCGKDKWGGTMWLAHNGVLGFTSKEYPSYSDTRILSLMLSRLPAHYVEMKQHVDYINELCSWDKIIIMDSRGNCYYFGASGVDVVGWEKGIWASNSAPIVKIVRECYVHKFKREEEVSKTEKASTEEEVKLLVPETKKKIFFRFPSRLDSEWRYLWIPSKMDEIWTDWAYHNGSLYGDSYYIDKNWFWHFYESLTN